MVISLGLFAIRASGVWSGSQRCSLGLPAGSHLGLALLEVVGVGGVVGAVGVFVRIAAVIVEFVVLGWFADGGAPFDVAEILGAHGVAVKLLIFAGILAEGGFFPRTLGIM